MTKYDDLIEKYVQNRLSTEGALLVDDLFFKMTKILRKN